MFTLNLSLLDDQITDLLSDFAKSRSSLPPLVLVTPHDQGLSSPWTSLSSPCGPVLHRLQQLAREAMGVVSQLVLETRIPDTEDVKVSELCP